MHFYQIFFQCDHLQKKCYQLWEINATNFLKRLKILNFDIVLWPNFLAFNKPGFPQVSLEGVGICRSRLLIQHFLASKPFLPLTVHQFSSEEETFKYQVHFSPISGINSKWPAVPLCYWWIGPSEAEFRGLHMTYDCLMENLR